MNGALLAIGQLDRQLQYDAPSRLGSWVRHVARFSRRRSCALLFLAATSMLRVRVLFLGREMPEESPLQQELEWVRPVIVFHAAIAVKPKASKMYYT